MYSDSRGCVLKPKPSAAELGASIKGVAAPLRRLVLDKFRNLEVGKKRIGAPIVEKVLENPRKCDIGPDEQKYFSACTNRYPHWRLLALGHGPVKFLRISRNHNIT